MDYARLEQLCNDKKISASKLAEMVGISKGNTSTWKKGGNPSIEVLVKMAEVLDCSVDYLLGNESVSIRPGRKYNVFEVLEASKADYLSNSCRVTPDDSINFDEYSRFAAYLNADPAFLINASNTHYVPKEENRNESSIDTDMVFEIINLMSYLPGNDNDRVLQIQISRIVLYNLSKAGISEQKIRDYNSIVSGTLDFLFSGGVDYKKAPLYGLRFNDLRSLNVKTGLSYQYMFTGIMTEKDNKSQN